MTFALPTGGRPGVLLSFPDEANHRRQLARGINRLTEGHFNGTLFVTLDPGVTTTTVTDSRISQQTCASFMPQTATAAAEVPTLYATCTNGSLTINHTNSGVTDRTYTMGIFG